MVPMLDPVQAPLWAWMSVMSLVSKALSRDGSESGGVPGSTTKMQPFVASCLCRSTIALARGIPGELVVGHQAVIFDVEVLAAIGSRADRRQQVVVVEDHHHAVRAAGRGAVGTDVAAGILAAIVGGEEALAAALDLLGSPPLTRRMIDRPQDPSLDVATMETPVPAATSDSTACIPCASCTTFGANPASVHNRMART